MNEVKFSIGNNSTDLAGWCSDIVFVQRVRSHRWVCRTILSYNRVHLLFFSDRPRGSNQAFTAWTSDDGLADLSRDDFQSRNQICCRCQHLGSRRSGARQRSPMLRRQIDAIGDSAGLQSSTQQLNLALFTSAVNI